MLFLLPQAELKTKNGEVISVKDGDTLILKDNRDKLYKVRLADIDAPEIDQAYGKDSKVFLKNMLSNQTITVNTVKKDRYNRELSEIYLYFDGNPVFVNAKMIKSGNAWVYKIYRNNGSFCCLMGMRSVEIEPKSRVAD